MALYPRSFPCRYLEVALRRLGISLYTFRKLRTSPKVKGLTWLASHFCPCWIALHDSQPTSFCSFLALSYQSPVFLCRNWGKPKAFYWELLPLTQFWSCPTCSQCQSSLFSTFPPKLVDGSAQTIHLWACSSLPSALWSLYSEYWYESFWPTAPAMKG